MALYIPSHYAETLHRSPVKEMGEIRHTDTTEAKLIELAYNI
jgi:hypothetical protein